MQFYYEKLWSTMERCGISRAQLRQRLGLSSATMAKLSANQPVAMDVLGRICDELGCSLSDVVSGRGRRMSEPAPVWSGIRPGMTYLLKMFFRVEKNVAEYIYGFATPYHMPPDGMDRWTLRRDDLYCEFYVLDGYLTEDGLRRLVSMAAGKHTLEEIMEALQIRLSCAYMRGDRKGEGKEKNAVLAGRVCNGQLVYRPAFIQPSETRCATIREELRPLASFEEGSTLCESLFGTEKRCLYTSGVIDVRKAERIWAMLQKELPLCGSLNEIARLGNFEVFSSMTEQEDDDDGIHWEVLHHEDKMTMQRVAEALELRIDHRRIRGSFAVNLRLYNTENPFADVLELLYCDGEDVCWRQPLTESVSRIELRVWKLGDDSNPSNLICDAGAVLVREVRLEMRVLGRTAVLEDAWTRRMEDSGHRQVDKKVELYSSLPVRVGGSGGEVWYEMERRVQSDFREMLGSVRSDAEDMFFPEGEDHVLDFLAWLKRIMDRSSVHRVILIDPYIEGESVRKLVRSLHDTDAAYEIYTDSAAGRNASVQSERMDSLRKLPQSLKLVAPSKFKVHAIKAGRQLLHDRYLILLDDHLTPRIFTLSNSLDGMANRHASLAVRLGSSVARSVFDYYTDLLKKLSDGGKVEVLFESVSGEDSAEKRRGEKSPDGSDLPFEPGFDNFFAHLDDDMEQALYSLAFMPREERERCIRAFLEPKSAGREEKLAALLREIAERPFSMPERGRDGMYLSAAQLMQRPFDSGGELLQSAGTLIDYSFEYTGAGGDHTLHCAVALLWKSNEDRCLRLLEELRSECKGDTCGFLAVAQLLGRLMEELTVRDGGGELRDKLLRAGTPLLRALGVVKTLFPAIDAPAVDSVEAAAQALSVLDDPAEHCFALLYLMKELQVRICRESQRAVELQPVIDRAGALAAEALTVPASDGKRGRPLLEGDALYDCLHILRLRGAEDICKLLSLLWKGRALSADEARELMIRLFMEKYRTAADDERIYFRVRDIEESRMIADYLEQLGTSALRELKKQLMKLERKLSERLYSAFLRTKNYERWKTSIDDLCCLACVELELAARCPEELPPSRAVAEFERIASNHSAVLREYSEVYGVFLQYLQACS